MKRLLLWIVSLTILFSSGIALAGQLGGKAPLPAFAQWFVDIDGKPCHTLCLFGIEPGVTKYADVDRILRTHPLIRNLQFQRNKLGWFHFDDAQSGYLDFVVDPSEDGTVGAITLDFFKNEEAFATFGDILVVFGIPRGVNVTNGNYLFDSFLYPDRILYVDVDNPSLECKFDPSANVILVSFYSKESYQTLRAARFGYRPSIFYAWMGINRNAYLERQYDFLESSCTP